MFIATYNGKAASYTVSGGHTFKKGSTKQISLDVPSDRSLYEILQYNPEFYIQEIGVEPLKEEAEEEIQPLDHQPVLVENTDSMPTEEEAISDADLFPLRKTEQSEPQQASSKRGKRR